MGVYIDDNKLVTLVEPKSIRIDLTIKINKNLKHDIHIRFIVSCHKSLTEYTIKNEISQLLFKYGHEHKRRSYLLECLSCV